MPSRCLLLCLLLCLGLDLIAAAVTGSGPGPVARAGSPHFKLRKRDPATVLNPLLAARQVKADTIRRGPTKTRRQADCPTPQPSGGCCPPGTTLCSGDHEVGEITVCSDLNNDHDNCRACAMICGDQETCVDGDCTACDTSENPYPVVCGNTCIASDKNNCGACGAVCSTGQCAGYECCASGLTACNGKCIDTSSSDRNNCGACGAQCAATEFCDAYECFECSAPNSLCGNVCDNHQNSYENCGSCGNACDMQVDHCVQGQCCPFGETVCNGVCTNLQNTFAHCGSCGKACGSKQLCSSSKCISCPSGYPLCGPDQLCTDILNDNSNCGGCGQTCSGTCVDGHCCPTGSTLYCNGQCKNGNTDANNCGTCGSACSITTSCGGGACLPCTQGYLQCDGTCQMWSVSHCGSCTHQCAADSTGCTLYGPGTGPWKDKYCCLDVDRQVTTDCVG